MEDMFWNKKEVKHTITWMNFENNVPERRQTQSPHLSVCNSVYMKCPKQANLYRQKDQWMPRANGEEELQENEKKMLMGTQLLFETEILKYLKIF